MSRHPSIKIDLDPGGTSTSHLCLVQDHDGEASVIALGQWQTWRGKAALRLLCRLEVHHAGLTASDIIKQTVSHLEAVGTLRRDESGTLRHTGGTPRADWIVAGI